MFCTSHPLDIEVTSGQWPVASEDAELAGSVNWDRVHNPSSPEEFSSLTTGHQPLATAPVEILPPRARIAIRRGIGGIASPEDWEAILDALEARYTLDKTHEGRAGLTPTPTHSRRGETPAGPAAIVPPAFASPRSHVSRFHVSRSGAIMQSASKTLGLLLSSRKIWVSLGALAGVIVTVIGADPAKWTPVIASIVSLAGVCIGAIAYEDAADKGNPAGFAPDAGGSPVPNSPPPTPQLPTPQTQVITPKNGSNLSPERLAKAATNLLLIGLVGMACMLAGCQASPSSAYVAGDQATLAAVGPEYAGYVHHDAKLSSDQVARRDRTLATWQLRVNQAGGTAPASSTQPSGP